MAIGFPGRDSLGVCGLDKGMWCGGKAGLEDLLNSLQWGQRGRGGCRRWPAAKLERRLGNWNWRVGRRVKSFTASLTGMASEFPGSNDSI